jgi:hypothetical protein
MTNNLIGLENVVFRPAVGSPIARSEAFWHRVLVHASKILSNDHWDYPSVLGSLHVETGVDLDGVTRANQEHVARELGRLVAHQIARRSVRAADFESRRAFFAFGEQLPTEAKSLDQLLIERMRNEKAAEQWINQAIAIVKANPQMLADWRTREALIRDWIYAQGPNPTQKNPFTQLHETWRKARDEAIKVLTALHKGATSAQDFISRVKAEAAALEKDPDPEKQKVGVLLRDRYLVRMRDNGSAVVRQTNPQLNSGDWELAAAQTAKGAISDSLPFITLPNGVPTLPAIGKGYLKARGTHAAAAKLLAEQTVNTAHQISGGIPSNEYHFVESSIVQFRYSNDPVKMLAAQILQRFMHDQKKKWIHQHVGDLIKSRHKGPPAVPTNSLMADVAEAKDPTKKLKPGSLMYNRVKAAWDKIQQVVDPAVINRAGPVVVRVHKGIAGLPESTGGYRANYNHGEINIGTLESPDQIMHEYGHHIEDRGGLRPWLAMQRLLHHRSPKGDLSTLWMHGLDEQRHTKADFPAVGVVDYFTGSYAGKYYESGSTELVSMGLEYLWDPKKAARMYMVDPERFITFLGIAQNKV